MYETLLSAAQAKGPAHFLDHEIRRKEMKVQSCEDERRGVREKCSLYLGRKRESGHPALLAERGVLG